MGLTEEIIYKWGSGLEAKIGNYHKSSKENFIIAVVKVRCFSA